MERETSSNIIELRLPEGMEIINGVRVRLGDMSLKQLVSLEESCRQRADDARTEAWLVQFYIERATPPEGGAA